MSAKCAECLRTKSAECNNIPDEYCVYTDVTPAEEQADAQRGVHRISGARAQRARCMMAQLGAARILAMAEQLKKIRE